MPHKEAGRLAFLQAVALEALEPDQQQHLVTRKRELDTGPSLGPHPDSLNQPGRVFEHLTFNLPGGRAMLGLEQVREPVLRSTGPVARMEVVAFFLQCGK